MTSNVDYEWDEDKADANLAKHGVSFESVVDFEWPTAVVNVDDRKDYGEDRYRAFGFIGDRLHSLAFTPRDGKCRVISLRKANRREVNYYVSQQGE